MYQGIDELIQKCTVRVTVLKKAGHGTGFFVAPGLVLTCAHVLQGAPTGEEIQIFWEEHPIAVQFTDVPKNCDLALLHVDTADHPCIFFKEEIQLFDPLYTYGYSDQYASGDSGTFSCEGWSGNQREYIKFKAGQVRPGFSGAPLLNIRTGYICGIIQTTRDRSTDLGGRAISTAVILREFPDLLPLQRQFHNQDRRWLNCLGEFVIRTTYLETIDIRYGAVTLPLGPVEGLSLQAIFQPLKLRLDPLAAEDLLSEKRRALLGEVLWEESASQSSFEELKPPPDVTVRNSEEALEKSPSGRMVILGGPGTGKTTTLKYLLRDRAQVALTDLASPMPLFISLADFASSGKAFQHYLIDYVDDMGIDESFAEVLWKMMEAGEAFLCLDSLDEVDLQQRSKILNWINTMASRAGNMWIIGSRFTEYKGGQFRRGQFTEWELQPLSRELFHQLVHLLLPELYRTFHYPERASDSAFLRALENHPQAADWSSNPLLVSLAAIVFVRIGTLPSSRTLLYREVTDAVLESREQDTTRRELLRSVIAQVALAMYQRRGRTFTLRELNELLPQVRTSQRETWETAAMSKQIISSGILEVVAKQTYGFRHQTFQEYLVATELARRFVSQDQADREEAWQLAWNKHTYSRWVEVLSLLVGVLVQEQGKKGKQEALRWLGMLIEQGVMVGGDPGAVGLALAIRSLSEVAGTPVWSETQALAVETEIVSLWANELLAAARRGRITKRERLQSLTREVGYLHQQAVGKAVDLLKESLQDRNRSVRRVVLETLGALGEKAPVDLLVSSLHHPAWDVRALAAIALGGLKERMPVEPLVASLQDESEYVRAAAAEALGTLEDRAPLEPLLAAFQDRDDIVRRAVVQALKALGEKVPLEALLIALLDANEAVRAQALEALMARGESVPVPPLTRALYHEAENVRTAAVMALKGLSAYVPVEPLLVALQDSRSEVRAAAAQVLGSLGASAPIEPLVRALQDEDWHVRAAAAESLETLRDYVPREVLLATLNHPDGNIRMTMIRTVGALVDNTPIDALVRALHDPDDLVRRAAVESLARLGEQAPIEPLLEVLHDQAWGIRKAAVDALETLGQRTPVEPLITAFYGERAYTDANEYVRAAIIQAFSRQKERAPAPLLIEALFDESEYIRAATVRVLGILGETIPLEPLIEALQKQDITVRQAAVEVLGALGEAAPIDPLMASLSKREKSVRIAAIHALGALGQRVPLPPLVEASHDVNEHIRQAAIEVLGELGARAPVDPLLEALQDQNEEVRRAAAEALASPGVKVPAAALLKGIQSEDKFVRRKMIQALGFLGEQMPVEPLLAAFHDEDSGIRVAVLQAMTGLRERLPAASFAEALQDPDEHVRLVAIEALGRLEEQVPLALFEAALHHADEQVRAGVVQALGILGERVPIQFFIERLRDESAYVRITTLQVLRSLEKPVPLEPVLAALQDADWSTRVAALEVLGGLGKRTPVRALVSTLQDPDEYVRRTAVEALGSQGERAPLKPLLKALQDSDWNIRAAAAGALGKLGARAPLDALIKVCQDSDEYVRQAAVEALNSLGERVPVEPFLLASYDESGEVCAAAVPALMKRGETSRLIELLSHRDGNVRAAVVQALGSMKERVDVEALLQVLQHQHDYARRAAAEVLGLLGADVPPDALFVALQDQDENVRVSFIQALCTLGASAPAEPLIKALYDQNGEIRRAATETLSLLGTKAPVDPLVASLGDKDGQVRKAAIRTLQKTSFDALVAVATEATAILSEQGSGKILGSLTQGFIARTIGDIGYSSPTLLEKLTQLLDWPYWQVRVEACVALGKIRRNIPNATIRRLLELRHDLQSQAVQDAADDALAEILSLETGIEDE